MVNSMARCIIKVAIAFCLAAPTLCSPLMSPTLPLRATRLSNSLNPQGETGGAMFEPDWVLISKPPPRVVQQAVGARLELECEAMGANPMIQWVRGDSPLTENESYESNSISSPVQGVSTIRSRLVINNVLPPHQGPLSCVASSGARSTLATTELYVVQGGALSRNLSSLLTALPLSAPRARIVLWNSSLMRPQGSDVIAPCRALGGAQVFWLDQEEQVVGQGDEDRVQVLPDGALRIRGLQWRDMGPYTCVARNAFSKDSVSTFIYPLLKEN